MPSGVELKLKADTSDAQRGTVAYYRIINKCEEEMKGLGRAAKKTGRDTTDAMGKAGRSAKGAGDKVKGVSNNVSGVGKAANATLSSIKSWVGGFIGVSSVVMTLRQIVAEMKEIGNIRSEFFGESVNLEQVGMKLAHLRGDVGEGSQKKVQEDIMSLAKKSHVAPEVAGSTLFYAESSMGTGEAATNAAQSILEFAGPAGLTPDETSQIPKIFNTLKATTREQQMEILNQIKEATGRSIAETGEYLDAYMKTFSQDMARGYTLEQSLSKMTAMIETTGTPSDAASAAQRVADVTAGRNEKALKFLSAEAETRGMDFGQLTDPQRFYFGRQVYQDYEDSGRLDELKTQLDVKGFSAMRAAYSDAAIAKHDEVLQALPAAGRSGAVESMAAAYGSTATARQQDVANEEQWAAVQSGQEDAAFAILQKKTEGVMKHAMRNRGVGETLLSKVVPDERNISQMIVRGSLQEYSDSLVEQYANVSKEIKEATAANETDLLPGLQAKQQQLKLQYKEADVLDFAAQNSYLTNQPELVARVAELTNDFSMTKTPALGGYGTDYQMKGLQEYYGLEDRNEVMPNFKDTTDRLLDAATKLQHAADKLNEGNVPIGGSID